MRVTQHRARAPQSLQSKRTLNNRTSSISSSETRALQKSVSACQKTTPSHVCLALSDGVTVTLVAFGKTIGINSAEVAAQGGFPNALEEGREGQIFPRIFESGARRLVVLLCSSDSHDLA